MPPRRCRRGGAFLFTFAVPPGYPHDPPKVKCATKVFHPNIDLEGNVCLNILREDWKPVLTVTSVVYGLNFLFLVSEAARGMGAPRVLLLRAAGAQRRRWWACWLLTRRARRRRPC